MCDSPLSNNILCAYVAQGPTGMTACVQTQQLHVCRERVECLLLTRVGRGSVLGIYQGNNSSASRFLIL